MHDFPNTNISPDIRFCTSWRLLRRKNLVAERLQECDVIRARAR